MRNWSNFSALCIDLQVATFSMSHGRLMPSALVDIGMGLQYLVLAHPLDIFLYLGLSDFGNFIEWVRIEI